jgi:MYXO-CTERM domain-containing protein
MLTAQTPESPATPRSHGYAALALLSLGAGFLP